MKKLLLLLGVFTTSFTYSQSNPWVNCDNQEVFARLKAMIFESDNHLDSIQRCRTHGIQSSTLQDTCLVIDLAAKCPNLDSNAIVLMCFDQTGKASYTVIKSDISKSPQVSYQKAEYFSLFMSDLRTIYSSSTSETIFSSNGVQIYEMNDGFSPPNMAFLTDCDTCVARIIGIGIGEKNGLNDSLGNPINPCQVHCDSFHAGPIGPPPPGGTLGQGPLTAHAGGNGIVTYKWSFAGSPLSGSGPNCPNIDMTAIPGGGVICVTVTNWLPNGDSCSCVMCIGLCYNICQPTKMAGRYSSPDFQLYPSPAKDKINLSLHATVDDIALLTVVSKEGKEISKVFYPIAKGVNKYEIDLKTLATGQYYISVQSKSFKEQRSFLKE